MGSSSLFAAGPQSGGRPPAPGRLALLQAFVNSHFDLERDRGADLLASPETARRWLESRGLAAGRVGRQDLVRANAVREGLRARLAEHNGAAPDPAADERLREATRGLVAAYALEADGATVPVPASATRGMPGALGLVLALVHEAQVTGAWPRLKACPGPDCGWVFFDTSRNNSSRWCSMRVCGGREKARRYRRREAPA